MSVLLVALALGVALPTEAEKSAPLRVAITDLDARGVDKDTVALVVEVVAAELTRQGGFQVMSSNNVRKVVGLQQKRQLLGCSGEDCYTYLGGLLKAERLVTGSLDLVGADKLLINLQMIHSQKAEVVGRASFESAKERSRMVEATKKGVESLLEIPARLHLYGQVDRGRVLVDDELVGVMPLKPFPLKKSGAVTLRVEHYDFPDFEKMVELSRGRTTRVRLDMTSFVELESERSARKIAGWITGGAAVLSAVGGTLLLAEGYSIASDYDVADLRRISQPELDSMADESRQFLGGGYAAVGVGAVALGVSLYLLLADPYEELLDQGS